MISYASTEVSMLNSKRKPAVHDAYDVLATRKKYKVTMEQALISSRYPITSHFEAHSSADFTIHATQPTFSANDIAFDPTSFMLANYYSHSTLATFLSYDDAMNLMQSNTTLFIGMSHQMMARTVGRGKSFAYMLPDYRDISACPFEIGGEYTIHETCTGLKIYLQDDAHMEYILRMLPKNLTSLHLVMPQVFLNGLPDFSNIPRGIIDLSITLVDVVDLLDNDGDYTVVDHDNVNKPLVQARNGICASPDRMTALHNLPTTLVSLEVKVPGQRALLIAGFDCLPLRLTKLNLCAFFGRLDVRNTSLTHFTFHGAADISCLPLTLLSLDIRFPHSNLGLNTFGDVRHLRNLPIGLRELRISIKSISSGPKCESFLPPNIEKLTINAEYIQYLNITNLPLLKHFSIPNAPTVFGPVHMNGRSLKFLRVPLDYIDQIMFTDASYMSTHIFQAHLHTINPNKINDRIQYIRKGYKRMDVVGENNDHEKSDDVFPTW